MATTGKPTLEEYIAKVNSGEKRLVLGDSLKEIYDPTREWFMDFGVLTNHH